MFEWNKKEVPIKALAGLGGGVGRGGIPEPDFGEELFTSVGPHIWVAPAKAAEHNICVVCIGGGGGGDNGHGTHSGGGGGLGWKNNIPVVAGQSYTLQVGQGGPGGSQNYSANNGTAGTPSYFINPSTVMGEGGSRYQPGGYAGDGGGNGGHGVMSLSPGNGGGGGGAGGYSGNGGPGSDSGGGSNGSGGAGSGGAKGEFGPPTVEGSRAGGGGGVGVYGQGPSGTGGTFSPVVPSPGSLPYPSPRSGQGGSGGGGASFGSGGLYGGGGAGGYRTFGGPFGRGGGSGRNGAVRIIWGPGRAFPNTKTGVDGGPAPA